METTPMSPTYWLRSLRAQLAFRPRKTASLRRLSMSLRLERLEERDVPSAGMLDPTFGIGGVATTSSGPFQSSGGDVSAVAVQSTGKIVLIETDFNNGPRLTRLNPNGGVD